MDAQTLEMLRAQGRLDDILAWVNPALMMAGDKSITSVMAEEVQRQVRKAMLRRVEAGQPVTEADIALVSSIDGRVSAVEIATMLAARDAQRDQKFEAQRSGSPSVGGGPVRRGREEGTEIQDAFAAFSRWLDVPAQQVVATMLANRGFDRDDTRRDWVYEAIAIAWARTAVGEGAIPEGDLPAAVRTWMRTDERARQTTEDVDRGAEQRAALVDALSAGHPRARSHMLPAYRATPVRVTPVQSGGIDHGYVDRVQRPPHP